MSLLSAKELGTNKTIIKKTNNETSNFAVKPIITRSHLKTLITLYQQNIL